MMSRSRRWQWVRGVGRTGTRVLLVLVILVVAAGCGSSPERRDGPDGGREPPGRSPRLVLAGDGEAWVVDVAAEKVRHMRLPELVGGDPPYRIVRRRDRLVAWGYTTYLLDPDLRRRPKPLVRGSWFFIPSARQNRVWIAFLDPESPETARGLRAVREMTVDGKVTVADARPPGGRWPQAATTAGLLFSNGDSKLEIWDPVAGRVVRTLDAGAIGDLGPTHGNLLASCTGRCDRLRLTDVRTGHARLIAAPEGYAFEPWTGQFAPSGGVLGLAARPIGRGPRAERRLALVQIRSAAARLVPGSEVRGGYTFVTWAPSGQDLFLTGGLRRRDRAIVAYRVGDRRARRLAVSLGPFYGAEAI